MDLLAIARALLIATASMLAVPSICKCFQPGCAQQSALALDCSFGQTNPCKIYATCVDSNGPTVAGGTASCPYLPAAAPDRVCPPPTDFCKRSFCNPSSTNANPCQEESYVPSVCAANCTDQCSVCGCANGGCTTSTIPWSPSSPTCGSPPMRVVLQMRATLWSASVRLQDVHSLTTSRL